MAYYKLLNLKKEPFSNSPDPELFFHSYQHKNCLQKLEIALRLRRGLSVVIGHIGTGKSTLSRQLVRVLNKDNKKVIPHLILDPEFTSPQEFLKTILKTFGINDCQEESEWQMKEAIKTYLFEQGVDNNLIPALIIDEGQKLPDFCIEILREFLNYETNRHKLLQIIIFAQKEFNTVLKEKANFADRVTTLQRLTPLNYKETRQMIQFRIEKSQDDHDKKLRLFTPGGYLAIYLISGGYPRKIVMLCSKILFNMLVKKKKRAGFYTVLSSARETSIPVLRGFKKAAVITAVALLAISFLYLRSTPDASKSVIAKPPIVKSTNLISSTKPEKIEPKVNVTNKKNMVPAQEVEPSVDKIVSVIPHQAETAEPEKRKKETAIDMEQISVPQSDILGKLTITAGDSLSKMIARVYGQFNKDRLEAVLARNPQIENPSNIFAFTEVILPVLETNVSFENGEFAIYLASGKSLHQAYILLKEYPETAPPLRLKPSWQEDEQTTFSILVEELFTDEEQAENIIKLLPEKFKEDLQIARTSPKTSLSAK